MSEDVNAPVSALGQAEPAPIVDEGQAEPVETNPPVEAGATETAAAAPSEDLDFYDPKLFEEQVAALPVELQAQARGLRKQLLGDYTRKTQGIAAQKQKLELVSAFERDPTGTLQAVAKQYGFELTKAQAAAAVAEADSSPETWEQVYTTAEQRAEQRILQKLAPLLDEVKRGMGEKLETSLDGIDPDWRTYEAEMMEEVRRSPHLAKDPRKLYRLVVPDEVLDSRAMARALEKLKATTDAGQGAGKSTARKATPVTKQATSIFEAYEQAKRSLGKE